MTLQDVMGTLRQQHEVFTLSGAYIDGARFVARLLDTLGTVQITFAETPLTLAEAAVETGYSSDHLGWLIRVGKIPNGRRGAPRIWRKDLPARADRPTARDRRSAYDIDADARALRIPRQRG